MKATGMIRKIDDLGRVVIPKEIRKTLKIREGDPMEIYVERNGEVILKRYAPLGDIIDQIVTYANVLAQNTGFSVCITDTQSVIAVAGQTKKKYLDREISEELIRIMDDRALWTNKGEFPIKLTLKDTNETYTTQIVEPIIADGDAVGTVILFTEGNRKNITEADIKVIQSATAFLGKQME